MTILFDEFEVSKWAYYYCLYIRNDPEIRRFITNNCVSYYYCRNINDDPEIRKNITDSRWAYLYCKHIQSDSEMKKLAKKGGYKL